MPDRNPIELLQRRLVELGCPAKAVRRIVRETAEHYVDLQRAAQAQDMTPQDARELASEQLGDPLQLAEWHIMRLRNISWCGRHPIMGFGALPLLITPFIVLGLPLFGVIVLGLIRLGVHYLHLGGGIEVYLVTKQIFTAWVGYMVALVSLPIYFCWLARRCSLDFKWTLMACMWNSLDILLVTLFSILVVQICTSDSAAPPLIWYIGSYNFHSIHTVLSPAGDPIIPKFGSMLFEVLSSIQVAAIPSAVAAIEYVRQHCERARAR
jgi:hypothetical protein